MTKQQAVSIIIPTLNEADNIPSLLSRIDKTMTDADITYETVLIDDNSSDKTVSIANGLKSLYPLRVLTKRGRRGKAYSLLEGFDSAQYPLVAMIDADLQYAPEEIAPMYDKMMDSNADMIVTNRRQKKVSFIRQLSTRTFNLIFARAMFGIGFDTQSGLKLFRKRMLSSFSMKPSPWSFDLEFIVRAIEHKYKIASHDIEFEERIHGVTKVNLISTTFELAKASIALRWRTSSSRIRDGLKANNRFLKRAFGVAAIIASVVSLNILATKPTQALSLPVRETVAAPASLLDTVREVLVPNRQQQPSQQPAEPSAPQPTQAQAMPVTAAPATMAVSVQPATSSSSRNQSQSANVQPASTRSLDSNKQTLAAATATEKSTGVYESGYPNYILSNTATQRFMSGAQIALTAAIMCVVAVAIILTARGTKLLHKTIKD